MRLRLLIGLFTGSVLLFALNVLPSIIHHDTGIRIRTSLQGVALPDGFYVYQCLSGHGIRIKSITPAPHSLVILFDSPEQSQAAERLLRRVLPYGLDICQLKETVSVRDHTVAVTQHT
nr:EnvZ/OmpR regulon moderator MzrA [Izhakiella capsodis]